jgi:predicted Fe-Mo cluster-binding NifX family protein
MKIALPSRGSFIDDHFGHCESFTVFTINENDEIESRETIPSENGCGCKSGIAGVLKEKGVEIMLAGNMGDGAVNVLERHDIAVFRGCRGDVTEVTRAFLRGELNDSGESCSHHHGEGEHGHQCHHQ